MRTIEINSRHFIYQHRHGLLAAISRLTGVIEYNLIDSGFADLRENIESMITSEEAEHIIDFIGYKEGINDIYLLIDELQLETEVDLSPQNVLFIMISPANYVEEQLNINEETALWLYDRLHTPLVADDLLGFMKELLLDAENDAFYSSEVLSQYKHLKVI